MLRLFIHSLFILIVFFVSFFAEASGIGSFLGKAEDESGPCLIKKAEEIPALDYHEIAKIGDQKKAAKLYCKAVQFYAAAKVESTSSEEIISYWISMIESYFYQYDYNHFFDESFSFIEMYKFSARAEEVHYLMLKAITELSRMNPIMENPYLLLGMGASPEQFNQDSPKQILKYRSFLEKYPNSIHKDEVFSWLNEIRTYFNNDYANDVRMMVMRREYAPAISKYQFLLSQGPALPQFTLIVYECIQVMRDFASSVNQDSIVPNVKLARWLVTTEDKITTATRQMVQTKLQEQSSILLRNLIEKFPNDEWTKKAIRKFGRPSF